MNVPPLFRIPLVSLLAFAQDGRVFRSFDHLILARAGSLLLVPVWAADGDLRRVTDGCPVPWEEVFDVLDAPAAGVSVGDPDIVPRRLRELAGDDWQLQMFRMARRTRPTRRFVHSSGVRYADL